MDPFGQPGEPRQGTWRSQDCPSGTCWPHSDRLQTGKGDGERKCATAAPPAAGGHVTGGARGAPDIELPGDAEGAQSILDLVSVHALHSSHQYRLTGNLLWCNHCGAYGQQRFKKSLKDKCAGPSTAKSKGGQLAQLRKGLHPLSGAVIGAVASASACSSKISPARAPSTRSSSMASPRMTSLLTGTTRRTPMTCSRAASATARLAAGRAVANACNLARGVVVGHSCDDAAVKVEGTKALVRALYGPICRAVGEAFGKLV